TPAGPDMKEGRCESNSQPSTCSGPLGNRRAPRRRIRLQDTGRKLGICRLQWAIVLSLVGKKEVGPPETVKSFGLLKSRGRLRKLRFEDCQSSCKIAARRKQGVGARIDHWQCKMSGEETSQVTGIDALRAVISLSRSRSFASLQPDPAEIEPLTTRL